LLEFAIKSLKKKIKQKYSMINLYLSFIQILKEKEKKGFSKDTLLHNHHVHPKHDGGDPNGEVVRCTIRDHARAHYIRYKVYGQSYDLIAYYGLVHKTEEKERLIQEKIVSINRERGNGMFNQKWQEEMANRPKSKYYLRENPDFAREIAQKGGIASGKIMTDAKKEALRRNGERVGKLFGRKDGLKHQHPLTREKLSKTIEWEHESGVFAISPPMESVSELVNFLNIHVPNSVKNSSGLSEILREVEPRRYGWKIVRILDL
jgi:general stress protein YciG